MDEDAWHDDWSKARCGIRNKDRVYEISMALFACSRSPVVSLLELEGHRAAQRDQRTTTLVVTRLCSDGYAGTYKTIECFAK
jgi:hypothetical protein